MRVKVEATVDELEQRSDELIKALAEQLRDFDPDLSDALEKAAQGGSVVADTLQYRVLRDLKAITTAEYKRQLQGMVTDITAVMEAPVLRKAFGDPPEKPEAGEEPEEKPEPGDYNPKTDEIVPEPEPEEDEEEDTAKSWVPDVTAGKAGLTYPR